jgi:4,5-dihydroxyphthalate decarboxylase
VTQLKVLLGDYPHTAALKSGLVKSSALALDFVAAKPLNTAFKRMVRGLEFDISELSLITFLQARDAGQPLVLLPAVMMSRFQHPYLVYNSKMGEIAPGDLSGRRIGCRLYTANTAVWLRCILAGDYGTDLDTVRWIVFQEPHVAGFRDPANVEQTTAGSDLMSLLMNGDVDAIIVDPVPPDPWIKPVIPDPAAAAQSWAERHNAIQVNHMIVARQDVTDKSPEAVSEFYRLLSESKNMASSAAEGTDPTPMGLEANRRNIALTVDCAWRQGLITRRFEVDELFNTVTAGLC